MKKNNYLLALLILLGCQSREKDCKALEFIPHHYKPIEQTTPKQYEHFIHVKNYGDYPTSCFKCGDLQKFVKNYTDTLKHHTPVGKISFIKSTEDFNPMQLDYIDWDGVKLNTALAVFVENDSATYGEIYIRKSPTSFESDRRRVDFDKEDCGEFFK